MALQLRNPRAAPKNVASPRALVPVPLHALNSTVAASSGNFDGVAFYCDDATPVLNLASCLTVAAGATPTVSRYGVFKADPANGSLTELAAATTNDTALFTSGVPGVRRKAPSSGSEVAGGVWTPTVGQYYIAGPLVVSGASMPTFVSLTSLATISLYDIGGTGKTLFQNRYTAASDLPIAGATVTSSVVRAPVVFGEYA